MMYTLLLLDCSCSDQVNQAHHHTLLTLNLSIHFVDLLFSLTNHKYVLYRFLVFPFSPCQTRTRLIKRTIVFLTYAHTYERTRTQSHEPTFCYTSTLFFLACMRNTVTPCWLVTELGIVCPGYNVINQRPASPCAICRRNGAKLHVFVSHRHSSMMQHKKNRRMNIDKQFSHLHETTEKSATCILLALWQFTIT